mmetsp:Transcript_15033/g.29085  ORF Transcript_15033/g.29085 Transcript_15033/m.29085 type:complete len:281 (+) Transcript_15033:50-892(+)
MWLRSLGSRLLSTSTLRKECAKCFSFNTSPRGVVVTAGSNQVTSTFYANTSTYKNEGILSRQVRFQGLGLDEGGRTSSQGWRTRGLGLGLGSDQQGRRRVKFTRDYCSETETAPEATGVKDVEESLVYEYEAPFWKPLKRVKILSVSSLVATFTSLPVMLYIQGSTQFSGRIGAVMTVGLFSLFTTSMLHWFSSPYICFLRHEKGSDRVEVETCTLLGTKRVTNFKFEDMLAPDGSLRPLITFELADGTPFYIDEKHISYEAFLRHLPTDDTGDAEEEES